LTASISSFLCRCAFPSGSNCWPSHRPTDRHQDADRQPGLRQVGARASSASASRGECGLTCLIKRPTVEDDPSFYRRARGYPISVTWGSLGVTQSSLQLFDGRGKRVSGRCFTPERAVHSTRLSNGSSAFFLTDQPLQSSTDYTVEFTATERGQPILWRWTFATSKSRREVSVPVVAIAGWAGCVFTEEDLAGWLDARGDGAAGTYRAVAGLSV